MVIIGAHTTDLIGALATAGAGDTLDGVTQITTGVDSTTRITTTITADTTATDMDIVITMDMPTIAEEEIQITTVPGIAQDRVTTLQMQEILLEAEEVQ